MDSMSMLQSVMELKARLFFLPVQPFYLLVLNIVTSEEPFQCWSLVANDQADTF